MDPETRYETQRIDHLGIVAGICREIGVIEEIDQQVGASEQKVSCGQGVQVMVLNALGFTSRALYLMPDYLHNKPVDPLIGPELKAEDFNDDSLGRTLEHSCIQANMFETALKLSVRSNFDRINKMK